MPEASGLTIRQHERQDVELHVEFAVSEEQRQQVRFSSASGATNQFTVPGRTRDISTGGMGLVFPEYTPKMCEGTIRVFSPTPASTAKDGSYVYEAIFEHRVKVRRVYMSSHDPEYTVGVSFVDPALDIDARVEELMFVLERYQTAREREVR